MALQPQQMAGVKGSPRMIHIYKTEETHLETLTAPEPGCWIDLTAPGPDEIQEISDMFHIEPEDLSAALDEEESSRVAIEEGYTQVLVDIPVSKEDVPESYYTIPLGMIFTSSVIITVCSQPSEILAYFSCGSRKYFSTRKKLRFIYQILEQTASQYQLDLRTLDKVRQKIETRAGEQAAVEDLVSLHQMETSLVYFATSLRANEGVLDRLKRYVRIKKYPEDQELLDDAIIETNQAIEMTSIYKDIVNGTRDLLSSLADNRLNNVMKYLTSLTLVLAIPTIISGFYGMNVNENSIPLADRPDSFLVICLLTLVICILIILLLKKRKML